MDLVIYPRISGLPLEEVYEDIQIHFNKDRKRKIIFKADNSKIDNASWIISIRDRRTSIQKWIGFDWKAVTKGMLYSRGKPMLELFKSTYREVQIDENGKTLTTEWKVIKSVGINFVF